MNINSVYIYICTSPTSVHLMTYRRKKMLKVNPVFLDSMIKATDTINAYNFSGILKNSGTIYFDSLLTVYFFLTKSTQNDSR